MIFSNASLCDKVAFASDAVNRNIGVCDLDYWFCYLSGCVPAGSLSSCDLRNRFKLLDSTTRGHGLLFGKARS